VRGGLRPANTPYKHNGRLRRPLARQILNNPVFFFGFGIQSDANGSANTYADWYPTANVIHTSAKSNTYSRTNGNPKADVLPPGNQLVLALQVFDSFINRLEMTLALPFIGHLNQIAQSLGKGGDFLLK